MRTLEELNLAYKQERFLANCFDGRDKSRFMRFLPLHDYGDWDLTTIVNEDYKDKITIKPFTRENVLAELKDDLDFAFDKAMSKRGLSAEAMFEVIKMWNYILDEGLDGFEDYEPYGLPLLQATAKLHGFDDPSAQSSDEEDSF